MGRFEFEHPEISLPEGWAELTVYEFGGPICDGLEHRLIVTFDRVLQSEYSDLESFAARKSAVILGRFDAVEVVRQTLVSLENCAVFELRLIQLLKKNCIQQLQYFFLIDDNRGVTFFCRYTDKSFKLVGPEVRRLVTHLISRP